MFPEQLTGPNALSTWQVKKIWAQVASEGASAYPTLTFSRVLNVAGVPFKATVHLKSGSGAIPAGTLALTVPTGWTVDPAKPVGPIGPDDETTATFTITPSAGVGVNTNYRTSALFTSGATSGYTDNAVRIVPPVEGRFQRWGNWAEYATWVQKVAPQALRLGRSAAVQMTGVGETFTLPVNAAAPNAQNTNVGVRITTTFSGGSGFEDLTLGIVPETAIPAAAAAPVVDAVASPGEYTGEALDIGRKVGTG